MVLDYSEGLSLYSESRRLCISADASVPFSDPPRPVCPASEYFPGVARRLATRLRGTAGYGLAHSKPGQSGTPATLLRTGRS